jgi:uncharacterized membrane protein YfcA
MIDQIVDMIKKNDFLKKNMSGILPLVDHNFLKLSFIGTITGIVASFVGGGAEILLVPLLIYLNVLDDYKVAIGTSLASLLIPIGIVAVFFFAKEICNGNSGKCIKWNYAMTLSFFFIVGTLASYFTSKIDTTIFKSVFGIITILLGTVILLNSH